VEFIELDEFIELKEISYVSTFRELQQRIKKPTDFIFFYPFISASVVVFSKLLRRFE